MLTVQEIKEGWLYFTVVETVSQVYVYEVKAKSHTEAETLVKEGKAGIAKQTSEGTTTYKAH